MAGSDPRTSTGEPDVVVRVDKDAHVHERSQGRVMQRQDALEHHHVGAVDRPRFLGPACGGRGSPAWCQLVPAARSALLMALVRAALPRVRLKVVDGHLDLAAALDLRDGLDHERVVERVWPAVHPPRMSLCDSASVSTGSEMGAASSLLTWHVKVVVVLVGALELLRRERLVERVHRDQRHPRHVQLLHDPSTGVRPPPEQSVRG